MRIGIRYCGGCNQKYDRVAAVQYLIDSFPEVDWTYVDPDRPDRFDMILAVTGCGKECIPREQLQICTGKLLYINQKEDMRYIKEEIKKKFIPEV